MRPILPFAKLVGKVSVFVVYLLDKLAEKAIDGVGIRVGRLGANRFPWFAALPKPFVGFLVVVKLSQERGRFRKVVALVGMIFVVPRIPAAIIV